MKLKIISLYLDDRTKTLADEYAKQVSLSRSSAIRTILRDFFERRNKNGKIRTSR